MPTPNLLIFLRKITYCNEWFNAILTEIDADIDIPWRHSMLTNWISMEKYFGCQLERTRWIWHILEEQPIWRLYLCKKPETTTIFWGFLLTTCSHSTGASGYIGGDILAELISKYPAHSYRLLVRSEKNGQKIKEVYPGATVIQGDLDNSELLTKESAAADIIIRKESIKWIVSHNTIQLHCVICSDIDYF